MLSPVGTEILAWCVFVAILLAAAAYIVRRTRAWPLTPAQKFWYAFNVFVARVFWRATISGPLPVAPGRGAVVVCNHRAPIDPAFIELATHRVTHWMVAREYTTHWAVAWWFRMAEIIPVGRGGVDTAATKAAIRYAQQGELVGMFPEGGINTTGRILRPGRTGAALVALKARVPVIPCFVRGTRFLGSIYGTLLVPMTVHLTVGQPLDLSEYYGREDDRSVQEELTKRFLREIARLGGCPDFQPEIVSRRERPKSRSDAEAPSPQAGPVEG